MTKNGDILEDNDLMDVARMWYLRIEESEGDEETLDSFAMWINQQPEHLNAFEAIASFWSHIDDLPELQVLRNSGPSISEKGTKKAPKSAILKFERESTVTPPKRSRNLSLFLDLNWKKNIAAAILILTCAITLEFYYSYNPENTYQTAIGQRQTIHLDDSSTIVLNTASKVRVSYEKSVRKIHLLQGEAHFDVAKDTKRPFIVKTSQGSIRAVGTSFNICDAQNKIEVIVFEGTVAINHKNDNQIASPNQTRQVNSLNSKAILVSDGKRIAAFENGLSVVRPANDLELSQKNAWQKGKLIFRGQKLSEVITEMSRYTHKKIIITDEELRNMEMGGAFDTDDFEAFIHAIEDAFPVKITRFTPYVVLISKV
ncbi:FecR family protein [Paremcibacter congregatus]|uniref:FecR family protein n=1 Tax=Paremcibacter congregatus TaxID=2043170 RepID=UPI0030EF38FA|tara:strand:+ start:9359 stop:10471 length:1113 start_codon:yes stop_codon:yes gene_type:complete